MSKEEIEKRIRQILSNVPDEYKVRKLVNLVKESIQRFIEETRIERIKSSGNESWSESGYSYRKGWNEASDEFDQQREKWLKENLSQ